MAKIKIRRPEEPSEKKQFHKELATRNSRSVFFKYLIGTLLISLALNVYFLTRWLTILYKNRYT
jgi:hypothetical protein